MAIIASLSDKLSYNSVKMTHKIMYSNGCWAWICSLLRAVSLNLVHFKATEMA